MGQCIGEKYPVVLAIKKESQNQEKRNRRGDNCNQLGMNPIFGQKQISETLPNQQIILSFHPTEGQAKRSSEKPRTNAEKTHLLDEIGVHHEKKHEDCDREGEVHELERHANPRSEQLREHP